MLRAQPIASQDTSDAMHHRSMLTEGRQRRASSSSSAWTKRDGHSMERPCGICRDSTLGCHLARADGGRYTDMNSASSRLRKKRKKRAARCGDLRCRCAGTWRWATRRPWWPPLHALCPPRRRQRLWRPRDAEVAAADVGPCLVRRRAHDVAGVDPPRRRRVERVPARRRELGSRIARAADEATQTSLRREGTTALIACVARRRAPAPSSAAHGLNRAPARGHERLVPGGGHPWPRRHARD